MAVVPSRATSAVDDRPGASACSSRPQSYGAPTNEQANATRDGSGSGKVGLVGGATAVLLAGIETRNESRSKYCCSATIFRTWRPAGKPTIHGVVHWNA